jgi:hypothetical protein
MPEVKSSWQKVVEEVESVNVDKTLNARAERYGKFKDGAALMQSIKRELAAHAAKHGKTFADDQWEALEMIVHKIGRIVNGDPDVTDHWVDIAGYATLIARGLKVTPGNHDRGHSRLPGNSPGHSWREMGQDSGEHGLSLH